MGFVSQCKNSTRATNPTKDVPKVAFLKGHSKNKQSLDLTPPLHKYKITRRTKNTIDKHDHKFVNLFK